MEISDGSIVQVENPFYPKTFPSRKVELMQQVFESDWTSWQIPEEDQPSSSLFRTIERYTLDRGLSKKREFFTPEGQKLTAEGTPMYNRSAFIHLASEQMKDSNFNGSFWMMDIQKLRDADLAVDGNGNKSADYILNKVATVLDSEITRIRKEFSQRMKKNVSIQVCRYGGDEFMFLIDGVESEEQKKVMKEVRDAVEKVEGYYLIDNGTEATKRKVKGPVGIKVMSEIPIPENLQERELFNYYLNKGLILEKSDIERIKERNPEDIQDILLNNQKRSIYPPGLIPDTISSQEALQLKINYIKSQHPELDVTFSLANISHSDEAMVSFIENVMYDRMLDEVVLGFNDLEQHVMNGSYEEVVMLDIKFIKEINDSMSVVEGDKAITQLWLEIQKVLKTDEEAKRKYQTYRRGGTFAIAFTEQDETIKNKLIDLQKEMVKWNGTSIPIGYADWDTEAFRTEYQMLPADDPEKKKGMTPAFGNVLKKMENDWQQKIGQEILDKINTPTDKNEGIVEENSLSSLKNKSFYSIDDLILMYYRGIKRGVERNTNAIEYYEHKNKVLTNQEDIDNNNKLLKYHREMLKVVAFEKEQQALSH